MLESLLLVPSLFVGLLQAGFSSTKHVARVGVNVGPSLPPITYQPKINGNLASGGCMWASGAPTWQLLAPSLVLGDPPATTTYIPMEDIHVGNIDVFRQDFPFPFVLSSPWLLDFSALT